MVHYSVPISAGNEFALPFGGVFSLSVHGARVLLCCFAAQVELLAGNVYEMQARLSWNSTAAPHRVGVTVLRSASGQEQTRVVFSPAEGSLVVDRSTSSALDTGLSDHARLPEKGVLELGYVIDYQAAAAFFTH